MVACNQTRNTRLAAVCETTEGVPVSPSAGTDFQPIQTGAFSLTPEIETLTNDESTGSLGPAKSISGPEAPAGSVSLYMRHSGVEGTEPGLSPFLEAAFGQKVVHGTERDTVGGSTTTVVNVDTGEGVDFVVGQALLIKDATNGYSIRPIESITGDALTLGVAIGTAPAAAVNLGDAVTFRPIDCGHKTLSIWDYRGNGTAVQMMAGSRVTNTTIDVTAGELINSSFDLEGISYYFNPVEVVAGVNDDLDFTDDGGTVAATIPAKIYKKPSAFAEAVAAAMNAVSTDTITVTYSNSTGKFTIANTTGAVLSLLWFSGANTATTIGGTMGFVVASDDTGSLSYVSDNALDIDSPYEPDFSAFADPLVAKNHELFIGDQADNICIKANSVSFSLGTPKANKEDICAESGISGSVISERTATLSVTAFLDTYDADKICRLLDNTDTRAVYNAGLKDGSGNWIPGYNWMLYMKTATVSSYSIDDLDGLVAVSFELTSFVKDGEAEVFLSFV